MKKFRFILVPALVFIFSLCFTACDNTTNGPSGTDDPVDPSIPTLVYTSSTLPGGQEGEPYTVNIGTAELPPEAAPATISYTLASGSLPAGLTLSGTGLISGTPAAGSAGTRSFSVRASAAGCNSKTAAFSVTIEEVDFDPSLPTLVYTASSLPAGKVGQSYSADIGTAELPPGAEPAAISYTLTSGSLPAGLTLSGTGLISGTPATGSNGTQSFSVRASAAGCNSKTAVFSVAIAAADDGSTLAASKISGGGYHSLMIDSNGTLWAWGNNYYGQLGDHTTTQSVSPVKIQPGTKFASIAGGMQHSAAIDMAGNLWVWGANGNNQLGNGSSPSNQLSPLFKSTGYAAIAAGGYHSLAISSGGALYAWGNNTAGQLGIGNTDKKYLTEKVNSVNYFTEIAAGEFFSMAIDSNGALWTWGHNSVGQLGDGTNTQRELPVQIQPGTKFTKVAAGAAHCLAIDSNSNLWAWGRNNDGMLGDGTTTNKNKPVQIKPGTKFSVIAAGYYHSLAIDSSGNLWAWGYNIYGQLGDGTTASRNIPKQIMSSTKFKTIEAGMYHSLAIDSVGNIWIWGDNGNGQLGNGTTTDAYTPQKLFP